MDTLDIYKSIQHNNPDLQDVERIASVFYDPCFTRLGETILTSKNIHQLVDNYEFIDHIYRKYK